MTLGGACSYEIQKKDGLHRCAIGCLLTEAGLSETVTIDPDTASSHSLHKTGDVPVRDMGANFATLQEVGFRLKDLDGVETDFLDEVQMAHDYRENWDVYGFNFKVEALDEVALAYGLAVPVEEAEGAPLEAVLV